MPTLDVVPFDARGQMLLANLPEIEATSDALRERELATLQSWAMRRGSAVKSVRPTGDESGT